MLHAIWELSLRHVVDAWMRRILLVMLVGAFIVGCTGGVLTADYGGVLAENCILANGVPLRLAPGYSADLESGELRSRDGVVAVVGDEIEGTSTSPWDAPVDCGNQTTRSRITSVCAVGRDC